MSDAPGAAQPPQPTYPPGAPAGATTKIPAQAPLPPNPQPTGTIDLTELTQKALQSFITWGDGFAYADLVALPMFSWLAFPGISVFARFAINWVVSKIANTLMLQAFIANTVIRKAAQASDYIAAYDAKEALPITASDAEYAAAEAAEMLEFKNFVTVTN